MKAWGRRLAALLMFSLALVVLVAPAARTQVTSLGSRDGEWPMFKGDAAHTGVAALSGAITAHALTARWELQVTEPGSRMAGGPVIGIVGGRPQVFAAVCAGGSCGSETGPGRVVAVDGASGQLTWETHLPGVSQADPYAPLLADVDADGSRELIVASNNGNEVFALRAQDEDGGPAGSIGWTFTFEPGWTSEAAPAAADLDPSDPALEVLLGTDSRDSGQPARFYAIDGATGLAEGQPFRARRRHALDDRCSDVNKMDSSSPAVATVGGRPTVYVGAWDGRFYALEWRAIPRPGLYARWTHELPRFDGTAGDCSVRKVRNGAVVGQVVRGGPPEVAFGYMAEPDQPPDQPPADYPTARLRVLSARGLALVADGAIPDWKSSPSLADLLPDSDGLELAGGRYRGVYTARVETDAVVPVWDLELGDGNGGWGGNRSSPAIADIDGHAGTDVIIGIEGAVEPGVSAFDGDTGSPTWRFPVPAPGVNGSPALGDVDGDGHLEVVFLAVDGRLIALDSEVYVP